MYLFKASVQLVFPCLHIRFSPRKGERITVKITRLNEYSTLNGQRTRSMVQNAHILILIRNIDFLLMKIATIPNENVKFVRSLPSSFPISWSKYRPITLHVIVELSETWFTNRVAKAVSKRAYFFAFFFFPSFLLFSLF